MPNSLFSQSSGCVMKTPELYEGGCLCGDTTFLASGHPINPHFCSCTKCQKSSGAPTVAWVEFPLKTFLWSRNKPRLYRSSEKSDRLFCAKCGSFLGIVDDGYENISLTISVFKDPDRIVPNGKHSYVESKPSWWDVEYPAK